MRSGSSSTDGNDTVPPHQSLQQANGGSARTASPGRAQRRRPDRGPAAGSSGRDQSDGHQHNSSSSSHSSSRGSGSSRASPSSSSRSMEVTESRSVQHSRSLRVTDEGCFAFSGPAPAPAEDPVASLASDDGFADLMRQALAAGGGSCQHPLCWQFEAGVPKAGSCCCCRARRCCQRGCC